MGGKYTISSLSSHNNSLIDMAGTIFIYIFLTLQIIVQMHYTTLYPCMSLLSIKFIWIANITYLFKHLQSIVFSQKWNQNFPTSKKGPLSNSSLLSISTLASLPPSAKILGQSVMNFLGMPPVMVDVTFYVDLVFQPSSKNNQKTLTN